MKKPVKIFLALISPLQSTMLTSLFSLFYVTGEYSGSYTLKDEPTDKL